jgi:hypothetical protein
VGRDQIKHQHQQQFIFDIHSENNKQHQRWAKIIHIINFMLNFLLRAMR